MTVLVDLEGALSPHIRASCQARFHARRRPRHNRMLKTHRESAYPARARRCHDTASAKPRSECAGLSSRRAAFERRVRCCRRYAVRAVPESANAPTGIAPRMFALPASLHGSTRIGFAALPGHPAHRKVVESWYATGIPPTIPKEIEAVISLRYGIARIA